MKRKKEFRRIYIRHADKEYINGHSDMYKHDPGITNTGAVKTKMVTNHLKKQWGEPDCIIVSPYRRTRETAEIMKSVLDKNIKIYIDIAMSEYLGNHRNIPIDVTEKTKIHYPPHPESFRDMKDRVKEHHTRITTYSKTKQEGVVWIITHGLIMKQIANLSGIKMPKEFPTLTSLSIVNGENYTKSEITIFNENTNNTYDDNSDEDRESSEWSR